MKTLVAHINKIKKNLIYECCHLFWASHKQKNQKRKEKIQNINKKCWNKIKKTYQ
jgi:hypothetical protein